MNKKTYLLGIIDEFEQLAGELPGHLRQLFQEIREKLAPMSEQELEERYNMTVTGTAGEQQPDPRHPLYLLAEAYSEMEKIAKTDRPDHDQLASVLRRLRGYLDVPDRYFP